MDSKLFSFIAAAITSLIWTSLPSVFSIILLLIAIFGIFKRYIHIAYFISGIVWMASVGHWQYSLQLSSAEIEQAIVVTGRVTSLVHHSNNTRFNLRVDQINQQNLMVSRLVRLSWREPQWQVQQGQIVKLQVKLKPPHGLANQGGFHYQQWLFSQGIVATGYVKNSLDNSLISDDVTTRQGLLNRLLTLDLEHTAWITALTIGYRGLLQPADWQLVQKSGIAHLIAISGLHLAMVASISYFLLAWLLALIFSRIQPLHQINVHSIALGISLSTTLMYSALAGFATPTLRAWLMLTIAILLFLAHRNIRVLRLILIGFLAFLILFPLSIFGLSFWLSFSAVAIICFVFWRWPVKKAGFSLSTAFYSMLRVQLCLTLMMLPIVAWQFSYVSVVSPLVNLLAVPLVTLCLLPLCLLATGLMFVLPNWAEVLFIWADYILDLSLTWLPKLLAYSWSSVELPSMPSLVWICLFLALIFILLPTFWMQKKYLILLFLPFISFLFTSRTSEWRVDVLDVGQGVSVLISKNNNAILYDVGASYPSGFNMADSVILPILRARGLAKVDMLFISHGDNDHAGSVPHLLDKIEIEEMITTSDACRKGLHKVWQGLALSVLWPDDPAYYNDNNGSCVLMVSDGVHSLLLPGDIDKSIERVLLKDYPNRVQADILLAPHHGSNTSSSTDFIQAVKPEYVIFSQGFMNRWRFPRPEVITRYQQAFNNIKERPAKLYSTSETGQVSFAIPYKSSEQIKVTTYRQNMHPYWYANM